MDVERNAAFDEMLDDSEGALMVCGITFNASDILFNLDPISYRQGVLDGGYEDEEEEEEE